MVASLGWTRRTAALWLLWPQLVQERLAPVLQETVKKHGAEQVQVWRRSFDVPPPPIDDDSEFNPAKERRRTENMLKVGRCFNILGSGEEAASQHSASQGSNSFAVPFVEFRYAALNKADIPKTECLKDTIAAWLCIAWYVGLRIYKGQALFRTC